MYPCPKKKKETELETKHILFDSCIPACWNAAFVNALKYLKIKLPHMETEPLPMIGFFVFKLLPNTSFHQRH